MLSADDRGPAWLQNDKFQDYGDIKADIDAMKQYASKLTTDTQSNYGDHVDQVLTPMQTMLLPGAPQGFYELASFLQVHQDAQDNTQLNVSQYLEGSLTFASAATDISKEYAGSDAFSHAKVSDVNKDLGLNANGTTAATDGTAQ